MGTPCLKFGVKRQLYSLWMLSETQAQVRCVSRVCLWSRVPLKQRADDVSTSSPPRTPELPAQRHERRVSMHTAEQAFHVLFPAPSGRGVVSIECSHTEAEMQAAGPDRPTLTVMVAHGVGIERRASHAVNQVTHTEQRSRKNTRPPMHSDSGLCDRGRNHPVEHPIAAHPACHGTHAWVALRPTLVAHSAWTLGGLPQVVP